MGSNLPLVSNECKKYSFACTYLAEVILLDRSEPELHLLEKDLEVTETEPVKAGWGACKSCGCKGYTKSSTRDMCGTCGHHWKQHW
jgi:hypothetical protein